MFNVTRDDSVKTRHLRPNDCLCEMRSLVDGGKGCLLLGKGFMTYSHLTSSKYIPVGGSAWFVSRFRLARERMLARVSRNMTVNQSNMSGRLTTCGLYVVSCGAASC
jgi:hypothetical protein